MQLFRNEVFSAPTSFFVLASLRQAVRFVCLAAASPDAAADAAAQADAEADVATVVAAGAAGAGGAAGASPRPSAIAHRPRDKAAARAAKLAKSLALMQPE